MNVPATVKWIGLALLGLVIAAAVAIAAGNLASQQIGISNESLTAGDQLAPAVSQRHRGAHREHPSHHRSVPTTSASPPATTTTETAPPPVSSPAAPSEPAAPAEPRGERGGGGGDSGQGGGGGGDD